MVFLASSANWNSIIILVVELLVVFFPEDINHIHNLTIIANHCSTSLIFLFVIYLCA